MGRSLNSCFKIMSCAGDPAKNDDALPPPESKTSPESIPIANNKQNQEAAADTVNSEKATVVEQANEISTLALDAVPSKKSEQVTDKSTVKVDYDVEEDVVVIVQASIRGYLAKRELEKIKNVVKLQATVRGYLVRRQAVGTLRCMLAIVKIQQIIRAHLAMRSTEFAPKENLDEETKAVKVKSLEMKLKTASPVIRNLASNAFATQLLKSTLKIRPIHISCNPLRPGSEWIWLERWMSLSLTTSDQQKILLNQDDLREDISTDFDAYEVENKFQVANEHVSSDSMSALSDAAAPAEIEVDSISNCSEKIELDSPLSMQNQCSNSPVQNNKLDSLIEETPSVEKDECTTGAWVKGSSDSVQSPIFQSSDAVLEFELNGDSNKPNYSEETSKNSPTKELRETSEIEIGHVVVESRKSRNPGFAAVQAKFEELSAGSSTSRSSSHAAKDTKSDSKSGQSQFGSNLEDVNDKKSVNFQVGTKFKEVRPAENFARHAPVSQAAALEHGNEISTTSVSDRSEAALSETNLNDGDVTAETDDLSCDSNVFQRQIMAKSINTAEAVPVKQQSLESITSNAQTAGSAKGPQIDRPSQEGSPRSHINVSESHGTPSSQISTDAKSVKAENSISLRKKRSQLLINISPMNSKNDSGAQTSGENLKKDTKNAKRRNSFSMAKTDHVDHENQTSSSNLLPSYMQPTESARAKVNTIISQKSSPDLHDKDNQIKKRHSLPNGDGKQSSSPRMQRSTSQAMQNLKGNGTHSPHNSTERRWLR